MEVIAFLSILRNKTSVLLIAENRKPAHQVAEKFKNYSMVHYMDENADFENSAFVDIQHSCHGWELCHSAI